MRPSEKFILKTKSTGSVNLENFSTAEKSDIAQATYCRMKENFIESF